MLICLISLKTSCTNFLKRETIFKHSSPFDFIRSLEIEKGEFLLGSVINAVVSQVMLLLRERNLQLIRDIPEEIKTFAVYGDQVRIQQVLADFLLNMVRYAPSPDGWVEIHVFPRLKQVSDGLTLLHAEFRYI